MVNHTNQNPDKCWILVTTEKSVDRCNAKNKN